MDGKDYLSGLTDVQKMFLGVALSHDWSYNNKHDLWLSPSYIFGLSFKRQDCFQEIKLKEDNSGFNLSYLNQLFELFEPVLCGGFLRINSSETSRPCEIQLMDSEYVDGKIKLIPYDSVFLYLAPCGESIGVE